MKHPGINRAIPGAIIGLFAGFLIVMGLRNLQGLPVWDSGVAIVLAAFTMTAGWLWGVGAFNPKLSEHGDHHDETAIVQVDEDGNEIVVHEAHHEEEEPSELFFTEFWKALSIPLVLVGIIFLFALLPDGFYLPVVDAPNASPTSFGNTVTVNIPFYGEVVTTQMIIFLGFIAFLGVSLMVFAGGLGFLLYKGHEQVLRANATESHSDEAIPPAAVRAVGRAAKNAARGTRKNLPKVLGNK